MSERLDNLIQKGISTPVLDHGFIRVVDYMGTDKSIVQAARVSYGSGTKSVREDAKLIHYLMRNNHNTPFEMCEIKFHIKMPIFVARQWVRHRTANINEYSARYSTLDNEFYIPEMDVLCFQSKSNKQGREGELDKATAAEFIRLMEIHCQQSYDFYTELLNANVARELARMVLPLNIYTQWYWKIDLHNLLHFLKLRTDPHAQYEIRIYANIIMNILEEWVPITMEAFKLYRLNEIESGA